MSSEGTLAVSAAVVALVQVLKWAGLRDSWGPLLVIVGSLLGVGIWLVSGASWPPARTDGWPIFTGWINVTLTTAGAFGFTRATAAAVTATKSPPADGAGSSPTVKPPTEGYLIMHAGTDHPALMALVPPTEHEVLTPTEAQHIDGRPIDPSVPVTCDSCGRHLDQVVAQGGQWVALDAEAAP